MGVGEKIKELREEANLKQYELAEKLNISAQSISFYESNSRRPDFDLLIKLADLFNVSLDYIGGRSKNRGSKNSVILEIEIANENIREEVENYVNYLNQRESNNVIDKK